jgi:hypothetical protein
MAEQVPFYIFTPFIFSYGMDIAHVSRNFLCDLYRGLRGDQSDLRPPLGSTAQARTSRRNINHDDIRF